MASVYQLALQNEVCRVLESGDSATAAQLGALVRTGLAGYCATTDDVRRAALALVDRGLAVCKRDGASGNRYRFCIVPRKKTYTVYVERTVRYAAVVKVEAEHTAAARSEVNEMRPSSVAWGEPTEDEIEVSAVEEG